MATTIAAVDPITGTRGLLVEVHAAVGASPKQIQAFKDRMLRRNIRVGLLVTRDRTIVLRYMLSSTELLENKYDTRDLSTVDLLLGAKVGGAAAESEAAFKGQVVQMLEAIASSWYSFLHPSAVSAMVPDVVGNLAEANLEIWDGLLDQHDAAE